MNKPRKIYMKTHICEVIGFEYRSIKTPGRLHADGSCQARERGSELGEQVGKRCDQTSQKTARAFSEGSELHRGRADEGGLML